MGRRWVLVAPLVLGAGWYAILHRWVWPTGALVGYGQIGDAFGPFAALLGAVTLMLTLDTNRLQRVQHETDSKNAERLANAQAALAGRQAEALRASARAQELAVIRSEAERFEAYVSAVAGRQAELEELQVLLNQVGNGDLPEGERSSARKFSKDVLLRGTRPLWPMDPLLQAEVDKVYVAQLNYALRLSDYHNSVFTSGGGVRDVEAQAEARGAYLAFAQAAQTWVVGEYARANAQDEPPVYDAGPDSTQAAKGGEPFSQ